VTSSRSAESWNARRAWGKEQPAVHAHILITLLELLPRQMALHVAATLATAMAGAGKVKDSRATVVFLGIRWSVTAYIDLICCHFLLGTVRVSWKGRSIFRALDINFFLLLFVTYFRVYIVHVFSDLGSCLLELNDVGTVGQRSCIMGPDGHG